MTSTEQLLSNSDQYWAATITITIVVETITEEESAYILWKTVYNFGVDIAKQYFF